LKELAELRRVYVAGCKNRLGQRLAGARIVIVAGQDVLSAQTSCAKRGKEKQREPSAPEA
jgi:hypothetical protein